MGIFKPMWIKVLSVMILVLPIVVVAEVFLLGSRKNQPISTSQTAQSSRTSLSIQPSLLPTSLRQVGATANWNTYADLENGFSIDYPSTWSQLILANHVIAITPHIPQPFYASDTFQLHPGILINVANDNNKGLNASDYVRLKVINVNVYTRNATIKTKLRTVDGVIVTGLINPQSGEDAGLTTYIANGTKVIEISSDQTGLENGEHLFNLMLSTLKLWRPQKPIR